MMATTRNLVRIENLLLGAREIEFKLIVPSWFSTLTLPFKEHKKLKKQAISNTEIVNIQKPEEWILIAGKVT